jgi:hypothetical protein
MHQQPQIYQPPQLRKRSADDEADSALSVHKRRKQGKTTRCILQNATVTDAHLQAKLLRKAHANKTNPLQATLTMHPATGNWNKRSAGNAPKDLLPTPGELNVVLLRHADTLPTLLEGFFHAVFITTVYSAVAIRFMDHRSQAKKRFKVVDLVSLVARTSKL